METRIDQNVKLRPPPLQRIRILKIGEVFICLAVFGVGVSPSSF